jgi:hypothetical protein
MIYYIIHIISYHIMSYLISLDQLSPPSPRLWTHRHCAIMLATLPNIISHVLRPTLWPHFLCAYVLAASYSFSHSHTPLRPLLLCIYARSIKSPLPHPIIWSHSLIGLYVCEGNKVLEATVSAQVVMRSNHINIPSCITRLVRPCMV